MEKEVGNKIVIIGCGNVAWHLAKHLTALKTFSLTVYNHEPNVLLTDFKTKLKCSIQTGLERIIPDASYYFICVSDEIIEQVAKKVNSSNPNAILLHTSGSAKMKILGDRIHGTGVFYPLQSFSRTDEVDWFKVPIIIEGSGSKVEQAIMNFAKKFSNTVISMPFKDRLNIHLAAVLVNNFTNALFVAADEILKKGKNKAGLKLLMPLIHKTVEKFGTMPAVAAQTGPAKRQDERTIKKHLALLENNKELQKAYKQISRLIQKQQKEYNAEL